MPVTLADGEPPAPKYWSNSTAMFFAASALAQKLSVAVCPASDRTPSMPCQSTAMLPAPADEVTTLRW